MSDRQSRFDQNVTAVQGWLGQVNAVLAEAAAGLDAGNYNLDDRIKAGHRLFNLQIEGWTAFAEAMIEGPWWRPPTRPKQTQTIPVEPADHARVYTIVEPFTPVSPPRVPIPDYLIEFEPPILTAGCEKFEIRVRDDSYKGHTYRGAVKLGKYDPPKVGAANIVGGDDDVVVQIPRVTFD